MSDPTKVGVIGTLLGAVAGGVFSLLGSVWVTNRQQHTQFEIKRKNIIYKPLYDELVDIKENILPVNPYPIHIEFIAGRQSINPHPQYSAWGRIKNDSRYLETPQVLKTQMENLYKAIEVYIQVRRQASLQIGLLLNDVLTNNGIVVPPIVNIGDAISGPILRQNPDYDVCEVYGFSSAGQRKLSAEKEQMINKELSEKANTDPIVLKTKVAYKKMLEEQDKAIAILSDLIQIVTYKYEA